MSNLDSPQAYLTALEEALVSEFRAYQLLVELTREERRLLSASDLPALVALLERKEILLGELNRLDGARQTALDHWARADDAPEVRTLSDLLPRVEAVAAGRLRRLREGILALVAELRELAPGNRALAQTALAHVEAVRDFLIALSQPAFGYQALGKPDVAASEGLLIAEQWA
jgi:flagellar biosynthesis/type III secretory pathway chaperone